MAKKKWTAKDLPNLAGRTIIVTGASSGIGLVAARELCAHGARVILAVRDVDKGRDVAQDFVGDYEVRPLNLADLESIRAFAAEWTGELDVLINNAGIMMAPAFRTIDDFELHMGTNHLGPFALTNLLLPFITDRVVTVSSILHRRGRIHLEDLHFDSRPYNAMTAYQDSKLANLLFTLELQRRLSEKGSAVRAVAAHPGIARTNLVAHVHGVNGLVNSLSSVSATTRRRARCRRSMPRPRTFPVAATWVRTEPGTCGATRSSTKHRSERWTLTWRDGYGTLQRNSRTPVDNRRQPVGPILSQSKN